MSQAHVLPAVFVISLERAAERRQAIVTLLNRLGVEFELFSAVDGDQLTEGDLSLYSERDAIKLEGRPLSKGEIGCYLSHIGVWKEIVSRKLPDALVLEDDAEIGYAALEVLAVRHLLPSDWEFVNFLSDARQSPAGDAIWDIYRAGEFRRRPNRTSSYLISQSGVTRLLAYAFPIKHPIDGLTGRTEMTGLRMYGIFPPIASLSQAPTTITGRGRYRPVRRSIHLIRQFFGRVLSRGW